MGCVYKKLRMDIHHKSSRQVVEEDRLSSLPDVLIHKIMSCIDMKYVVQTCLLSSRWKLLWTSMPFLNFSSKEFGSSSKLAKFVSSKFTNFVEHVLSHRDHQIQVSFVKLHFRGQWNQLFVQKIANYAFSHNVQELTMVSSTLSDHFYPPCLFSSQSLKQFTLTCKSYQFWDTTKTSLDFPALTTLNLSYVKVYGDLFSKCVNLKNLTLDSFCGVGLEQVFDIITPRLSNLVLAYGHCLKTINVIAPQLENLTIEHCLIEYLNAPPGISSFCYTHLSSYIGVLQFSNDRFYSLNKVTLCLVKCHSYESYKEEFASKNINMLQKLQSAKYLTLNADIVEYISSFPDVLSQHSSPFSNLICLTIDSSKRNYTYKVTMPSQVMKFLLDSSPTATFIMKLPVQSDWISF